jgi:hypothetical protein
MRAQRASVSDVPKFMLIPPMERDRPPDGLDARTVQRLAIPRKPRCACPKTYGGVLGRLTSNFIFLKGYTHVDGGSSRGLRIYHNRPTDQSNSFLHAGKTQTLAPQRRYDVESSAGITNHQMNLAGVFRQLNFNPVRAAVPGGIMKCLL